MKLLLIAGHGASDPGATATHGGITYREANETRVVVAGLVRALAGYADVSVYDVERNAFADYKAGTLRTLAQFPKYDYVLEIHFNALKADAGDGRTKGVECYVTTTEPQIKVETAIVDALASVGFTNRGVKRHNWSVIHTAQSAGTAAALLEVCFIDDADDMAVYLSKKQQVIKAIADGLVKGFGLHAEEKEETMSYEEFKAHMTRYEAEKAAMPPDVWSAGDRAWAELSGLITGGAGGNKRYKSHVTREELAAVAHRLVGLRG